jgi:hypothetical protein
MQVNAILIAYDHAAMPLLLLIAFPLLLHAQLTSTGSLQGSVFDIAGSPVPTPTITLQLKSSSAKRQLNANAAGQFQFSSLLVGEYTLTCEKPGFNSVTLDSIDVSIGQQVSQRIVMRPADLSERLEVQSAPESLQTSSTTSGVVLGGDRIEEAPAPGRNYLNFVLIAPGVASSSGSNTARSIAGLRNPANDSGVVFNGIRGRNNSISIDGMDNRDETTGGSRVALGLEMIHEFRVSGTAVSAELGGAAGGIVNVVTRSGQNLWHGDMTFFTQNEKLNARNAETTFGPPPRFRRYQPGISTGGPIQRDRTFFFTAFEQTWEDNQEWSDTPTRLLTLIPNRGLRSGLFDAGESDSEFSLKATHILDNANSLNARYAFSRGRVRNDVQSTSNPVDRSARGSSLVGDHSLVSNWSHALDGNTINDLRVQFAQRSATLTPNASGPMFEIPGVITFGQSYILDQQRTERHYELVETLQLTRGRHLISLGATAHTVHFNAAIANRFHGILVYPDLDAYLANQPGMSIQAFGNPRTQFNTTPLGVWLNDRWQLAPGLSIEAGIRYDRQWLPSPIPETSRNLAPRLGLAWHPSGTSSWVFRAGAGLFYDRYPLGFINDAIQKDGVNAWEIHQGSATRTTYRPASRFLSTYGRKLTIGLERKLDRDTTINMEYSNVRGIHLPRVRNAALTQPPQFHLEQTASSQYQGLALTLNRRLRNDLTYLFSYNLGNTKDDASDFDEHPLNPQNLRQDWALSRQHQRHRLALSGLFEMPSAGIDFLEEIGIAPVFQWSSARPLNPLLTSDIYQTGAYPISARPIGVARNSRTIPATASLDLRVMKTIPMLNERAILQFGVESFNLLNHTNRLRVSPYLTNTFGSLVEAQNPRQVQLMIQFEY